MRTLTVRRMCAVLLALAASLFFLTAQAATHEVVVGDNFFSPSEITIQVGDTVRWVNAEGGNFHDVTSSTGAFDPSATSQSFIFEVTFDDPGSFSYFCTVHPGIMQGNVTVEGSSSAAELSVTGFSAGNGPFSAGQEITLDTSILNSGDADSGAFSLDYFAQPSGSSQQAGGTGPEAVPDGAFLIGSVNIGNVSQGATLNHQGQVTIPGSIPPGSYLIGVSLNFSDANAADNELVDADVVQFIGEFFINAGLNDAWVNAAASFQGLFFTVFPDIGLFFLSWFTFDSVVPSPPDTATFGAHDHRWVTASGFYSGNSVELNVELTTGGIFNASDPLATQDTAYGTMTIVFNHCDEAIVTYNFPSLGISGEMVLKRAAPDNIPLCEALNAELQQAL